MPASSDDETRKRDDEGLKMKKEGSRGDRKTGRPTDRRSWGTPSLWNCRASTAGELLGTTRDRRPFLIPADGAAPAHDYARFLRGGFDLTTRHETLLARSDATRCEPATRSHSRRPTTERWGDRAADLARPRAPARASDEWRDRDDAPISGATTNATAPDRGV